MKHSVLLFFLASTLFAMERGFLHELSFMVGDSENGSSYNMDRSLAYELQYQYNGLGFPFSPELSLVYSRDIPLYRDPEKTRYVTAMANGVYEIPYTPELTPYLKAGLGYWDFSDVSGAPKSSPILDAGAGLKLQLNRILAVKFQLLYMQGTDSANILATGGISIAFGNREVNAAALKNIDTPEVSIPSHGTPATVIAEKVQRNTAPKEAVSIAIVHKEPTSLSIVFPLGKARLTEASVAAINAYAEELNREENKEKKLLIAGHTDATGPRAFNATLSMKRASAVYAAFIASGVDPGRLYIDGYGETMPIADNKTESGREKNRRVEVIPQKP